jgi:tRNA nucleotidyltransferase/poly(A) polymerase
MKIKKFKEFTGMDLPKSILEISGAFHEKGKKLFVVGGAVRDFLKGKSPKDFDLATDATPDESLSILRGKKFRTLEVGKAFGVVKAITSDFPEGVEIATFRTDGKSTDNRRPDYVEFTSIDNDVLRRDLTINALFYDIQKREIVDLVGGREDLENNVVRTVGKPEERFAEDALRKLRAVRFVTRLGATFDKATRDAIHRDPSLPGVSEERIYDEFSKIVKSAVDCKDAIELLKTLGFFKSIFPGIKQVDTSELTERMEIVPLTAVMLFSNSSNVVENLLKSMKWPNEVAEKVAFLISLKELSVDNVMRKKRRQMTLQLSNKDLKEVYDHKNFPLIEPFCKYTLSVKGERVKEETGLEGKALGEEIEKREREIFKELV